MLWRERTLPGVLKFNCGIGCEEYICDESEVWRSAEACSTRIDRDRCKAVTENSNAQIARQRDQIDTGDEEDAYVSLSGFDSKELDVGNAENSDIFGVVGWSFIGWWADDYGGRIVYQDER